MEEIAFISLIALIQHPEKYHGKKVRVVAYCSMEFEGKALWVAKDDLEKAITKNAVWLDVKLDEKTKKLDKKVVIVEGVYDSKRNGHLGMYSGMIGNVTRVELWEKDVPPPK